MILGDNEPEVVKSYIGDGSVFGIKPTYIQQGKPKGIAHAVYCAKDFIGKDEFVVYLGDNILRNGIKDLVEDFKKFRPHAFIALCKVTEPERYGLAELNDEDEVVNLVEKPKNPRSDLALIGVYIFRPDIFDVIKTLKPSWRNELEITEAINKFVQSPDYTVKAHFVNGWWKDTGKPDDILEANRLVLDDMETSNEGRIEDGVIIQGRICIEKGSVVREGSVIKGPVVIGKNCEIGPCTYIGPYTSVGDNTVIKGAEIEGSIIVGDAKIVCKKRVVDSIIGKGCNIISSNVLPKGHRFIIGERSHIHI